MISSGDFERYQRLYSKYEEDEIKLEDIARSLEIDRNYSKVFIHRLSKVLGAIPVERGKYVLVDPEVWMGLYLNSKKYPFSGELLKKIGRNLGNIEMIVVYGSWARSEQKKGSDVDIFIISQSGETSPSESGEMFNIEYSTPGAFLEELETGPLFLYSVLEEGDAIIGEELKTFFSSLGYDIEKLQDKVAESIAAVREARRLLKGGFSKSTMETVCYVSTLRLRTGFIAKSVIAGTPLSHKFLRKDFLRHFKKRLEFEKIFNIYMSVREDMRNKDEIGLDALKGYVNAVEKYLVGVWSWLDAKKEKAG